MGGGLIGKACAAAIAERGADVLLLEHENSGEASPASAGMLAPSVERAEGPAHDIAIAARDRYPSYLDWLHDRTGLRVPLNRLGVLQVAMSPAGVKGLQRTAAPGAQWLDATELQTLEPALSQALGALFSPDDGSVDNIALLAALDTLLALCRNVRREQAGVVRIAHASDGIVATDAAGMAHAAGQIVVAAGAWSARIEGARLARAVEPVRGQLVSYDAQPCRHTLYGPRGYLVPRGTSTLAGSTMERVGFDNRTTAEGVAKVTAAAQEICPPLAAVSGRSSWSGLRPVTPDLLPLLGRDPEHPRTIYATGHSRNGVLLAPLTADIVADLLFEDVLNFDISQYRPDRF